MMFQIDELHHVNLGITDVERSREFYCGVLGFKELPRPELPVKGLWLEVGQNQVHLAVPRDPSEVAEPPSRRSDHVAFVIDSLDELGRALDAAGVEVEVEVKNEELGMQQWFIRDPDSNRLEFVRYTGDWRPGLEPPAGPGDWTPRQPGR